MAVVSATFKGYTWTFQPVAPQLCVKFSQCAGWGVTTSVGWRSVPDGATVAFYNKDDCSPNAHILFSTSRKQSSGSSPLFGGVGLYPKSFMVLKSGRSPGEKPMSQCPANGTTIHRRSESARFGDNGNTSKNWFDPLPDGGSSA